MTADQFRTTLADLGISHANFAMLVGRSDRQVRRWAAGENSVPVLVAREVERLGRAK